MREACPREAGEQTLFVTVWCSNEQQTGDLDLRTSVSALAGPTGAGVTSHWHGPIADRTIAKA